jgi:ribosomal protein S18 acetylase RimI-like enzyme
MGMEPARPIVRSTSEDDADVIRGLLEVAWGSVLVARKGELLDCSRYPGFLASLDGEPAGLASIVLADDQYEVLSLSTIAPGRGVGQALMRRCFADSTDRGCRRVWLTTTNDNSRALDFYQRLGMRICAIHLDAVAAARELKPSIPLRSKDGVLIEHEIELEWRPTTGVGSAG